MGELVSWHGGELLLTLHSPGASPLPTPGCACKVNNTQLPQPCVMVKIAGKYPLVAMAGKWQVRGGAAQPLVTSSTAVVELGT